MGSERPGDDRIAGHGAWGFTYKTNIIWYKVRQDGGPDRRGVGFYFRNVTEMVLFGVRGSLRTLQPGRSMPNIIVSRKREHSRKPTQIYDTIEQCSPGPYLELFARSPRPEWKVWGDEAETYQTPDNLYSRQSETVGWRLFEKPEADSPIIDSPTTL